MGYYLRIFAKAALLLVIISLFMPMACDMNAFDLAHSGMVEGSFTFAVYLTLFTAIAGLAVGVLLFLKKGIPFFVDTIIVILCMLGGLIPFFSNLNETGSFYQSGAYLLVISLFAAFILELGSVIVTFVKKE